MNLAGSSPAQATGIEHLGLLPAPGSFARAARKQALEEGKRQLCIVMCVFKDIVFFLKKKTRPVEKSHPHGIV